MNRSFGNDSQFWLSMDQSAMRMFCHPFEQMSAAKWHEVTSSGTWDTARILQDHKAAMIHSTQREIGFGAKGALSVAEMSFKMDEGLYAFVREEFMMGISQLSIWATTPERAQEQHATWRTKYLKPVRRRRKEANFHVLSATHCGVQTQKVPIERQFLSREADIALHYGDDFPAWEDNFIHSLKSHLSGVTILRGEPGTGKTSFIRHLMHKLRRTHRFYYLPVNQVELLSSPQLVEFWIDQNRISKDMTKVIVIEDAELLMATRGKDNQNHVSNLLNISDGLLGEFLKMHLICTINCSIDKLDPAICRPGRLLAYRHFQRLIREHAERLAESRGLQIPMQERYTLAEIYNTNRPVLDTADDRRIGFR